MVTKRNYAIDFLRILACMMVVFGHTAAEAWYVHVPRSYEWTVLNVFDTFCRPSVPLFIMISGYLFLRKKHIDYKKLWLNNILHILVVYAVWILFYAIVYPGLKKSLHDLGAIRENILGLFPAYHMWYLRVLVGLYAIVPLLWALVRAMDKRLLRYFIFVFLTLGIIKNTIYNMTDVTSWIHKQIGFFGTVELVEYTGYFMLGYILAEEKTNLQRLSNKALFLIYLFTFIIASVLNQVISILKNEPVEDLYGTFSFFVMIEAVCLFVLFLRKFSDLDIPEKTGKWINRLSEATLFIYLIHPFVIFRFQIYFHFYVESFNVLFCAPILASVIFILSAIVGMILKRIPVIRYFM